MPHDANGRELLPGDLVTIKAHVIAVQPQPDYCNVSVQTERPMYPSSSPTTITLNAGQVEKVI